MCGKGMRRVGRGLRKDPQGIANLGRRRLEGALDAAACFLQPGRQFSRKGMRHGALDALLLFLLAEADGPVAMALREDVLSLRLAPQGPEGAVDIGPLAALPNLRALALEGANVAGPPPPLRLDRLELVAVSGLSLEWLEAAAPADFWTNGADVPSSVVRLRLDGTGTGCTGRAGHSLAGLPLLEELSANWCPALVVKDCPRLHKVACTGSFELAALASWGPLPHLESLSIENGIAPQPPGEVRLPDLPRLRTLTLDGHARLAALPATITHLSAGTPDLSLLAALDRPIELRVPGRGGVGQFPILRDGSALEVLDLSHRRLTDGDLVSVMGFPQLRRLHIAGTSVTNLGGLRGHARLEVLDISDCAALRNVDALANLPALRVVLMAGSCGMTPADLPPALAWVANRQPRPDIEALLKRERPRSVVRRAPPDLPPSAAGLFTDVFPLVLRRDYEAIDVAIDEFVTAGIPEVWDWWLSGVQIDKLLPRRMSHTLTDQPFARHAALRLIGAAPETCAAASRLRLETKLRSEPRTGPGGRFDLSLLAGLPNLESAVVGCSELKLPGSPRPEWLPRLTSLHITLLGRPDPSEKPGELVRRLRWVLPHVPNIAVR